MKLIFKKFYGDKTAPKSYSLYDKSSKVHEKCTPPINLATFLVKLRLCLLELNREKYYLS